MELLDGLLGNVIGSMLGGNQAQSPFGAARNQGLSGNLLRQIVLSMPQQNGGLEGVLANSVKAASRSRQTPGSAPAKT